jgi:hypothetical protein
MPISMNDNKHDFEELFFYKDCDIDIILDDFFIKYKENINGDVEFIKYKIKKKNRRR